MVPENIPTIRKKLILLPDFPFSSVGTCSGARVKAVDVLYPFVIAQKNMLITTNILRAID
jgi:hypothetical protein